MLVCFVMAVRVLSGPAFISAAIEHAELYSGVCLKLDPNCYVNEHKQIQLEEEPSNTLNLSFHLMGSLSVLLPGAWLVPSLSHALHARALSLLLRPFPNPIFHPPR